MKKLFAQSQTYSKRMEYCRKFIHTDCETLKYLLKNEYAFIVL